MSKKRDSAPGWWMVGEKINKQHNSTLTSYQHSCKTRWIYIQMSRQGPNYPEWTSMSQKTKTCGLYRMSVLLGSAHNQVPKELVWPCETEMHRLRHHLLKFCGGAEASCSSLVQHSVGCVHLPWSLRGQRIHELTRNIESGRDGCPLA